VREATAAAELVADAHEVIVVDDGSSDGTPDVVARLAGDGLDVHLIRHERNQGKGAAVRTGVLASRGDTVLFSDADFSTPIEDMELLQAALDDGADVAIGSRAAEGRRLVEVHQPWHRELMGRVFNLFVQLIVLPGLWDTQCGFKAFRGDVARQIFAELRSDGFDFDVEALYRAKRRGLRIREVAVHWRDSPNSRVSPLRDSARMFVGIFRIRRMVGPRG
jgi:dolichyl-phosphate beta-glucosyltransferase